MPNYDEQTGCHYGAIHQNSLYNCGEAFHDNAEDLSFKQYQADVKAALRSVLDDYLFGEDTLDKAAQDAFDAVEDRINDRYEPQNPSLRYDKDGYVIETCLDTNLIVIKSPFYTFARPCSPCVPNAGDLDTPDSLDGFKTYCLGHDWFEDDKAPYCVFRVEDNIEIISKVEDLECPNCKGTKRDTVRRVAETRGSFDTERIVAEIKAGTIVVSDFNEAAGDFQCWRCQGTGTIQETVIEEA